MAHAILAGVITTMFGFRFSVHTKYLAIYLVVIVFRSEIGELM
jgi:hypothetical protein